MTTRRVAWPSRPWGAVPLTTTHWSRGEGLWGGLGWLTNSTVDDEGALDAFAPHPCTPLPPAPSPPPIHTHPAPQPCPFPTPTHPHPSPHPLSAKFLTEATAIRYDNPIALIAVSVGLFFSTAFWHYDIGLHHCRPGTGFMDLFAKASDEGCVGRGGGGGGGGGGGVGVGDWMPTQSIHLLHS